VKKIFSLFVVAFLLMPLVSNAQQSETVVIGTINPALYKVAGDLTVQSFTVSPSTINTGDMVMSVIRWVSVSDGTVKVRLPYPGGGVDSTIIPALANRVYETRFWRNVAASAGTYTLTVSVIKGSETATATATLVVNVPANRPPTLTLNPTGPYSVAEGSTLNITLQGSDLDVGDVLTYSQTSIPAMTGATLNTATGAFSWTPGYGAAGTYNVSFKVTDNHGATATVSVVITVINTNRPPTLNLNPPGPYSVPEGSILNITLQGSDLDVGDVLTYSVVSTPVMTGATLNATSGAFAWTPGYGAAGTYNVVFSVNDGYGGSANINVVITVTNTNRPPTLTLNPPGPYSVPEGSILNITLQGSDLDVGDVLTYSVTSSPNMVGATFNVITGLFSWTPGYGTAGNYNVTFSVSDNHGATATVNTTITVTRINQWPIIDSFIGTTSLFVGQSGNYNATTHDPDGNKLTNVFEWFDGTPNYVAVKAGTTNGQLFTDAVSHTFSAVGTYSIKLTTTDVNGASVYRILIVVVNPLPNQPPVIDSFTGIVSLIVGQTGTYNFTVHDPDGKQVTNVIEWFDATSNYTSVKTGITNGQSFTDAVSHTFNTVGTYLVKLTTTDINTARTFQILTVVVNPLPNQPPVWTQTPYDINVLIGTVASLDYAATDADNDQLIFGASILQGTGSLYIVTRGPGAWRVVFTSSAVGVTRIQASVSDGRGGVIFHEVSVNVVPNNQRPEVKFIRFNGNFSAPGDANITIDGLDYEGGPGKLYIKYEYSNVSLIDSIGIFFPANLQTTFVPTPRVFNTNVGVVKCTAGFKDAVGAYSLSTWFTFVVSLPTSVEELGIPTDYRLSKNYPNPFNPTTTIKFALPNAEFVNLTVYDILGKEVAILVDENKPAGYHKVDFNAGNLPSGIYLYKLTAGKFTKTEKMILMK